MTYFICCFFLENKRSPLWGVIGKFRLVKNMRARENQRDFAEWLLKLGNGQMVSDALDAPEGSIDIPHICMTENNIVDAIFPNFEDDISTSVILNPKNDPCLQLSVQILKRLPGNDYTFYSHDSALCTTLLNFYIQLLLQACHLIFSCSKLEQL